MKTICQAHISANCVLKIQPEKYWSHFQTLYDNYRSFTKENLVSFVEEMESTSTNGKPA